MPSIKEVTERFLAGAFIAVAEYRGYKPEVMRYRDKKTGARVSSPILVHMVEVGESQVKVTEWLPDDAPVDAQGLPTAQRQHQKGDKVVLKLENLEADRGQYSARGTIHKLEADKKA